MDLVNTDKVMLFTGEGISPLGKDSVNMLLSDPDAIDYLKEIPPIYLKIKELYDMRIINKVITQNIDNLHLRSGIPNGDLITIHGNYNVFLCDKCDIEYTDLDWDFTELQLGENKNLLCECGGYIKSTIIDFGKPFDADKMHIANNIAFEAEICLVIGSDLNEYPSSNFPRIVGLRKKSLILINSDETSLDFITNIKLDLDAIEVLSFIIDAIRNNN